MKKQHLVKLSLAAAAVVGTLAGGNAMADVTVFGIVDAGVISSKAPGSNNRVTKLNSGGMTTSAVGVKGSEDLGNGLKANFALSAFIDLANGAFLTGTGGGNYLFTRESWVGLSSKELGAVSLGRDVNPSFVPTILFNAYGDSTTYSPLWHATYFDTVLGTTAGNGTFGIAAQARGLYDDTAWSNQVRYTTPVIGGVVADFNYAANSTGDNIGANAMYFNGPIGLSAYYMSTKTRSIGSLDTNIYGSNKASEVYFVGGSYDFGVAKVFATYQTGKQSATTTTDSSTYHVSAQIPAGPGKVLVSYADTSTKNASSLKFAQTAIGYQLPLSKKTDVYANYLYGTEKSTASSSGNAVGVGIRTTF